MAGMRGFEFYLAEYHSKGDQAFAHERPYPVLVLGRLEAGGGRTGLTLTEGVSRGMAQFAADASEENLRKLGDLSKTIVLELSPKESQERTDRVTLGRAHENDVVLPQQTISKVHAIFTRLADGRWSITDAGSRNGTCLNGHHLHADWSGATLEDGDRLTFGTVAGVYYSAAAFRSVLAKLVRI